MCERMEGVWSPRRILSRQPTLTVGKADWGAGQRMSRASKIQRVRPQTGSLSELTYWSTFRAAFYSGRCLTARRRLLAAAINSTVVAGENLTAGASVWLPAESVLPAADSGHHASPMRAEAR